MTYILLVSVSPAYILGTDTFCMDMEKDVGPFKARLFLDLSMLKYPSLDSPKRDIDRILYVKHKKNLHVVEATSLKIKNVLSPTFPITSDSSEKN